MKKKSLFILHLFLVIFVLTNVGCKQHKNEESKKVITLGVMSSLDYLPVAVANKMEYFEKNGVEVKIEKFFSANDRDAALQSGNLDGTILDFTGAAIQHAGGIKINLTSKCDGQFALIGKSKDIEGKKIAISRNTVIDYCTDKALDFYGVNEVERIEINKIPLRLEMIRNNQIDFTFMPEPFVTIAQGEGFEPIIWMRDMNLTVTGIVFTEQAILEKKDELTNFYKAYNQAVEYLNDCEVKDIEQILVEEIRFPQPLVSDVELPVFSKATLPNYNDLKSVEEWLKNRELLPVEYDIRTLLNKDFVE